MKNFVLLLFFLGILIGCKSDIKTDQTTAPATQSVTSTPGKIQAPDWAKNANLYEVNIRQYTPEGTFKALEEHLDRLKEMSVDILWMMPIHPISEKRRKGELGSYYAVSDFTDVNPLYGTKQDFSHLVKEIHKRGMKVLIDWVPHHTGFDHVWIEQHPDWFSQDEEGNIIDPINEETGEPWGWTDVAELKLDNSEMRKGMIDAMKYWLNDFEIDGFRVDHAHGVPDDYWDEVSSELSRLNRPIFMLAEGEEGWLRNTENFAVTYAWPFHHAMNDIAKGDKDVNILDKILAADKEKYTKGYHIYFTSNHDENSWAGTVMERMGTGHKAFAVLACTIDGMPLLYSGQEEPNTKRLEFFKKDNILWNDYAYAGFYKTLFELKKRNQALWNGKDGGPAVRINESDQIYAFKREKNGDQLVVILNLTGKTAKTKLDSEVSNLRNVFSKELQSIEAGKEVVLRPWEFMVLSNK